jgi:predicted lipase
MFDISTNFNPHLALELIHLLDRTYTYYECHDRQIDNEKQSNPYQMVEAELSWIGANQIIASKFYQQVAKSKDRLPEDFSVAEKTTYEILHRFTVRQDFIDSILIEEGETFFGFILRGTKEDSNKIYIVFRGTSEKTEWLQNCKIEQVGFSDKDKDKIKVSKGFKDVYSCPTDTSIAKQTSISKQLKDQLGKLDPSTIDSIIITGHSLGGAIASFAALETREIFKNIEPILYTFASPRVGNENFANSFTNMPQCFRVFNTEDIVPNVPLSSIYFKGLEMQETKPLKINNVPAKNSGSDRNQNLRESWFNKAKDDIKNEILVIRGIFNLSCNIHQARNKHESYLHIGVPVAFTSGTGYISTNHNLYETYRSAILKMILSQVDPESVVTNRETQISILR